MEVFDLSIVSTDRDFYEGPCESLVIPTMDGEKGILANHSNLIEAVVPGMLRFTVPGEAPRKVFVSSGMIKVEDGEVDVIVDSAERPEDIDEINAKRAAALAKEALLQKKSRQEYLTSQAELLRAMHRLKGRE